MREVGNNMAKEEGKEWKAVGRERDSENTVRHS